MRVAVGTDVRPPRVAGSGRTVLTTALVGGGCVAIAAVVVHGSPRAAALATACALLVTGGAAALATGLRADVALFTLVAFTAPWNAVRLTPSATVADVLLIGCLVLAVVRPGKRSPPPRTLLLAMASVVLILTGAFIASLASASPAVGPGIKYFLASVGVMTLVVLITPSRRHIDLWLVSFAGGAAASAVFGLLNAESGLVGRELGLTSHPNHLGLASCLGVFTAIAAWGSVGSWRLQVLATLSIAANVAGVLGSGSRAALLGLLVGALLVAVAVARRHGGRVVMAAACSAVLLMAGAAALPDNNAMARLLRQGAGMESAVAADELRRSAIDRGFDIIGSRPLVGSGFPELLAAHNIYVQAVVAGGVLGGLGIALLVITSISQTWRLFRSSHVTAWALAAALTSYLVCGLFQNILFDRYVWVVLALAFVLQPRRDGENARPG